MTDTRPAGAPTKTAVVLGAGGPPGIAWEIGLATGLADGAIDLRDADVLIGTSAGSVVAAKLASGLPWEQLYDEQTKPELQVRELEPPVDFHRLRDEVAAAREGGGGRGAILQRIGALAASTATVSEAERRRVIAARLPTEKWPGRDLRVVAVDIATGERIVFDPESGVDYVDAIAASCAVPGAWPPVTIDGRRYMDGGVYSTENAELATGCDRVLVVALRPRTPRLSVVSLDEALEALRLQGSEVEVIHPDDATEDVFASVGGNLLDPSIRDAAAHAGRDQGRRLADTGVFLSRP